MADTANLGMGSSNPYLGQQNQYLQQIIDSGSQDLVDNWNKVQLPAMNAAAIKSGSFGNSALDELGNFGAQGLQKNLADLSSKLRFNDYTQQQGMYQWQQNYDENKRQYEQNFDRGVYNDAYSQNQQNLQTGIGLLSLLNGWNTQDINNTTTQQNTPLNYWQQFLGAANGVGQGFGTSTSTTGTSSSPVATALGGAQLGSSWWNRGNSGYTGANGSGTNYSGDLANLGNSNGWWGTA